MEPFKELSVNAGISPPSAGPVPDTQDEDENENEEYPQTLPYTDLLAKENRGREPNIGVKQTFIRERMIREFSACHRFLRRVRLTDNRDTAWGQDKFLDSAVGHFPG